MAFFAIKETVVFDQYLANLDGHMHPAPRSRSNLKDPSLKEASACLEKGRI